ncbi:MAG: cell division protein ZapA [Bacteroidales bacterium]|nr:cell division protein ZapA [Bacteroidales bacterium]
MDDEFPITLVILDRPYKMRVKASEEETIRNAVKAINSRAAEYKNAFAYKDMQDILAMMSVEMTTKILQLEENNQYVNSKLMSKLEEIENVLEQGQ